MTFTIPGRPVTKKNSQRIARARGRRGYVLLPSAAFEKYQRDAGYFIPCKQANIDRPVNVRCLYYMPDRKIVDLVNLLEATCDILVHYHVLKDDRAAIVASHDGSRVLVDKKNPRVEIEITEAAGG